MTDEYREYERRTVEATRDASFALWNALLTLNGVIVSVFSAVAVFSPITKVLAVLIMFASMFSAVLLILNFRSIRNLYRFIGQMGPELAARLSAEQKQQQLDAALQVHRRCNFREATTLVILAIQSGLIFTLALYRS